MEVFSQRLEQEFDAQARKLAIFFKIFFIC
jgi:hypothetical protein